MGVLQVDSHRLKFNSLCTVSSCGLEHLKDLLDLTGRTYSIPLTVNKTSYSFISPDSGLTSDSSGNFKSVYLSGGRTFWPPERNGGSR